MEYKVKHKGPQGFRSYGNVKTNRFGNLELGLKATPEFKALVADTKEGDWINFSLFQADPAEAPPAKPAGVPF